MTPRAVKSGKGVSVTVIVASELVNIQGHSVGDRGWLCVIGGLG